MSNIIRIKRRASGAAGAPSSLMPAELAFNEVDGILYYGFGAGGAGGTATSVIVIGGAGAFVSLTGDQTISGNKTFNDTINGNINGNASSANVLSTPRNIAITGDATWNTYFDGSDDVTNELTLANSGVSAGTYGSSSSVPVITVDSKGRVTSVTTASISGSLDFVGDVTGSGSTGSNTTLTLAASGVTAGTYTKITVDAKGRATVGAQASLSDLSSPSADFSMNSHKLTGLATPSADTDAANKGYVDSVAQGLDIKASVKCATTANITLSGTQTIDGITVAAGDRVLVKNQSTASQNGIYVASASAWARSNDADAWAELVSAFVFVEEGSTLADTGWVCTVDSGGTLGTTNVTFSQFSGAGSYAAGSGLTLTGTTFSVNVDNSTLAISGGNLQIKSTWVGQSSITTLGTIGTGVWQGTTVAVAYGGTGATTLTGLVKGNGTSAMTAAVAGTDYLDPSSTIDGGTF